MQKLRKFAKRLKMNRYNKGFPEDKKFKLTFRFSASKNLNRTLGLGSFSLCFSAFIIAYNVVKPPISACSRLYCIWSIAYKRTVYAAKAA